jgi:hypothetical protein
MSKPSPKKEDVDAVSFFVDTSQLLPPYSKDGKKPNRQINSNVVNDHKAQRDRERAVTQASILRH